MLSAVDGHILYATPTSIYMIYINPDKGPTKGNVREWSTPKILENGILLITTLSKEKRVFWVQGTTREFSIRTASLSQDETQSKTIIQSGISDEVGGIAIDWLSRNIYWSQKNLQRIEVSRLDGRYKRVVVDKSGGKIGKVSVDPIRGYESS